jgi:hypothetical protein
VDYSTGYLFTLTLDKNTFFGIIIRFFNFVKIRPYSRPRQRFFKIKQETEIIVITLIFLTMKTRKLSVFVATVVMMLTQFANVSAQTQQAQPAQTKKFILNFSSAVNCPVYDSIDGAKKWTQIRANKYATRTLTIFSGTESIGVTLIDSLSGKRIKKTVAVKGKDVETIMLNTSDFRTSAPATTTTPTNVEPIKPGFYKMKNNFSVGNLYIIEGLPNDEILVLYPGETSASQYSIDPNSKLTGLLDNDTSMSCREYIGTNNNGVLEFDEWSETSTETTIKATFTASKSVKISNDKGENVVLAKINGGETYASSDGKILNLKKRTNYLRLEYLGSDGNIEQRYWDISTYKDGSYAIPDAVFSKPNLIKSEKQKTLPFRNTGSNKISAAIINGQLVTLNANETSKEKFSFNVGQNVVRLFFDDTRYGQNDLAVKWGKTVIVTVTNRDSVVNITDEQASIKSGQNVSVKLNLNAELAGIIGSQAVVKTGPLAGTVLTPGEVTSAAEFNSGFVGFIIQTDQLTKQKIRKDVYFAVKFFIYPNMTNNPLVRSRVIGITKENVTKQNK